MSYSAGKIKIKFPPKIGDPGSLDEQGVYETMNGTVEAFDDEKLTIIPFSYTPIQDNFDGLDAITLDYFNSRVKTVFGDYMAANPGHMVRQGDFEMEFPNLQGDHGDPLIDPIVFDKALGTIQVTLDDVPQEPLTFDYDAREEDFPTLCELTFRIYNKAKEAYDVWLDEEEEEQE